MMEPIIVPVTIAADTVELPAAATASAAAIEMQIGAAYRMSPVEVYDGALTVTPSHMQQVLETAGKKVNGDITVAPVPAGWGRIGWNGSYLTVS